MTKGIILLVVVLLLFLLTVVLDVIPCDSPWSVGPDCEEIIQELEIQEG